MYQFTQPNEQPTARDLPSVAMSYKGDYLEDLVPGYRTLTVSGRETIGYNAISAGNSTESNGVFLAGKSLPERILTITYKIDADNGQQFQEQFRMLIAFLRTDDDVKIVFRDDPDVYYMGQLMGMSEVNAFSNSVTGTFNIYCQDPMVYANEISVLSGEGGTGVGGSGTKRNIPISAQTSLTGDVGPGYTGVKPDHIFIGLAQSANALNSPDTILNSGGLLVLSNVSKGSSISILLRETIPITYLDAGNLKAGLLINFKDGSICGARRNPDGSFVINTDYGSLLSWLDYTNSDLSTFTMTPGDIVSIDCDDVDYIVIGGTPQDYETTLYIESGIRQEWL